MMNRWIASLILAGILVAVIIVFLIGFGAIGSNGLVNGGVIYLGDRKNLDTGYIHKFRVIIVSAESISPSDVKSLKDDNNLVLGYVNIGKISSDNSIDYSSKPDIFHKAGQEFFVEYWSPEWKSLLIARVDRIHMLGYSGVLLDDSDVYKEIIQRGFSWAKGVDVKKEMKTLLIDIISYCRSKYGKSFFIGIGLSRDIDLMNDPMLYREVDIVVFKELWHQLVNGKVVKVCECELRHIFSVLDQAVSDGKIVVVVDPVEDAYDATDFCKVARLRNYVPIPQPYNHWSFDTPPPPKYYG